MTAGLQHKLLGALRTLLIVLSPLEALKRPFKILAFDIWITVMVRIAPDWYELTAVLTREPLTFGAMRQLPRPCSPTQKVATVGVRRLKRCIAVYSVQRSVRPLFSSLSVALHILGTEDVTVSLRIKDCLAPFWREVGFVLDRFIEDVDEAVATDLVVYNSVEAVDSCRPSDGVGTAELGFGAAYAFVLLHDW